MTGFTIDPEIRKARTLPSEFYLSGETFEASKRAIFGRSWHFAGTADEVDNLKPIELLPGVLDEQLLLTKTAGELACVSNVCTHRGKVLIDEPCRGDLIRCGYHGRRFSLDGKFLSMPEFEGVENFPGPEDDLARIPLSTWGRFAFISLDPAATLKEFIGDAVDIDEYSGARLTETREFCINAHWVLYCENYLEGFHIPYVHRSLNEIVDYGTYTTEAFRYSSLQTGFDDNGDVAGRYLFVFPNLMFNFYPWGISVNVVRPVSKDQTVVEFLTYVSEASKLGEGAGKDLEGVEMEDEAVVESVQKGIRSRFYDRGRYSPTREQGTHHFHRLIAEFVD
ncbi:MAG: aromatic ring-hydroxylating dioxygenase subunit alpha [Pyrinomonadaceae bacterium]